MKKQIIIFTDLDGTLLDHNDYSYTAATPCLDYIRHNNISLIYTSSKTAVEIYELCRQTNMYHPFISENGGLLSSPKQYFSAIKQNKVEYEHQLIGVSRQNINSLLEKLRNHYQFTYFNIMTTDEIIALTGLTRDLALMANQRECTEPVHWLDNEKNLKEFTKILNTENLQLLKGGRFFHVMGYHDKATTMSLLIDKFQKQLNTELISIALGDSPNDYKMLKAADYGILIPNPIAPKEHLDNSRNLLYASSEGPQGWNDTLLDLLKDLS